MFYVGDSFMKVVFGVKKIMLIIGLVVAGLLCGAYVRNTPAKDLRLNGMDDGERAPLTFQTLNYTENPVDIPNPDRGF